MFFVWSKLGLLLLFQLVSIHHFIISGYYSDPEAECQAFHICTADGAGGLAKYSFLCPNGTLFNQNYFICDWWFNFDCATAEELYSLNDEIAAARLVEIFSILIYLFVWLVLIL